MGTLCLTVDVTILIKFNHVLEIVLVGILVTDLVSASYGEVSIIGIARGRIENKSMSCSSRSAILIMVGLSRRSRGICPPSVYS